MNVIRYEFDQVLGAKHLIHSNRVVSKAYYQILLRIIENVMHSGILLYLDGVSILHIFLADPDAVSAQL